MVGRCPICNRTLEPAREFCVLHNNALRNLEQQYPQWNRAFGGNLSKNDYYTKLLKLNETGPAAKNLIKYLRERVVSV
jgi:hypothetical protein